MKRALLLTLLLGGCHREPPPARGPGATLEAAAVARGLIADPLHQSVVGAWSAEGDRLCVVPAAQALRIGASVDYGEGQSCAASGTAEQRGDRLRVQFGPCRFDAAFDGERITFPADLPASCAQACTGRASLAALAVEQIGSSTSEAVTMRDGHGRLLCGG